MINQLEKEIIATQIAIDVLTNSKGYADKALRYIEHINLWPVGTTDDAQNISNQLTTLLGKLVIHKTALTRERSNLMKQKVSQVVSGKNPL